MPRNLFRRSPHTSDRCSQSKPEFLFPGRAQEDENDINSRGKRFRGREGHPLQWEREGAYQHVERLSFTRPYSGVTRQARDEKKTLVGSVERSVLTVAVPRRSTVCVRWTHLSPTELRRFPSVAWLSLLSVVDRACRHPQDPPSRGLLSPSLSPTPPTPSSSRDCGIKRVNTRQRPSKIDVDRTVAFALWKRAYITKGRKPLLLLHSISTLK